MAETIGKKREAFSIVREADLGYLEGVKVSALPKSATGLYAVKVTHDKDGHPSGFDVEPYEPKEEA